LHLQFAERRVSWLSGMIALLGVRVPLGPGEGNSPVSSSAFSSAKNFTKRCVSPPSHQTPCSYLLYQRSCEEKAPACPGWCLSISPSLETCFRETFDVGLPA